MTKNKLYSVLLIACLAGIGYLFYQINSVQKEEFHVCLFKNVTGFPCPSCGTTRAIMLLLNGEFVKSMQLNPFGIVVVLLMGAIPLWILADIILKKDTFYYWYKKIETVIRKPIFATILILIVVLNWIWNIYKHL